MAIESENDFKTISQLLSDNDKQGIDQLMATHRARLKSMIKARLDPRLAARVDPSDVVQETLIEAARKLPDYLQKQPIPFYPWLRRLAADRMAELAQRHIGAQRRSVTREQPADLGLSDESVMQLANRFAAGNSSPSQQAIRHESQQQVRAALKRLPFRDREVLLLQFVEQMSPEETATVLSIRAEAVGMRRIRALKRLANELGEVQP